MYNLFFQKLNKFKKNKNRNCSSFIYIFNNGVAKVQEEKR